MLELHLDILPMGRINLPQGSLGKVEKPRNDQIGELIQADIIQVD